MYDILPRLTTFTSTASGRFSSPAQQENRSLSAAPRQALRQTSRARQGHICLFNCLALYARPVGRSRSLRSLALPPGRCRESVIVLAARGASVRAAPMSGPIMRCSSFLVAVRCAASSPRPPAAPYLSATCRWPPAPIFDLASASAALAPLGPDGRATALH